MNLPNCVRYETRAYRESCGSMYPRGSAQYNRCVACGVWFSCSAVGQPNENPPCDSTGDVPAKPCYKYVKDVGYVYDPTDPRCHRKP